MGSGGISLGYWDPPAPWDPMIQNTLIEGWLRDFFGFPIVERDAMFPPLKIQIKLVTYDFQEKKHS